MQNFWLYFGHSFLCLNFYAQQDRKVVQFETFLSHQCQLVSIWVTRINWNHKNQLKSTDSWNEWIFFFFLKYSFLFVTIDTDWKKRSFSFLFTWRHYDIFILSIRWHNYKDEAGPNHVGWQVGPVGEFCFQR